MGDHVLVPVDCAAVDKDRKTMRAFGTILVGRPLAAAAACPLAKNSPLPIFELAERHPPSFNDPAA